MNVLSPFQFPFSDSVSAIQFQRFIPTPFCRRNVHVLLAKRTCFAGQTYTFCQPNVYVWSVKQRVKTFAPNSCLQMIVISLDIVKLANLENPYQLPKPRCVDNLREPQK